MKRTVTLLLGLVGFVQLTAAPAQAQQTLPGSGDLRLDASKFKPTSEENNQLQNFFREGKRDAADADSPEAKALFTKVAKWLVYRMTLQENQMRKYQQNFPVGGEMHLLLQEANRYLVDPKRPAAGQVLENQQKYMKEFSKALVEAIDEVLKNPAAIARINAAQLLARLGENGPEEIADAFCKVLEDKEQIDAVKFYALVGLKNWFTAEQARAGGFKNKEREAHCILVLLDYLNRKPNFKDAPTPEELEAFRYVRREAIRALALSRRPALVDANNQLRTQDGRTVGRTALDLLRVVAKDGFSPEPSFSEQIEAVIGICQLQSKLYPDGRKLPSYDPTYAAFYIGQFIVEFASRFDEDRSNNRGSIRAEAWKYQSQRLIDALTAWVTDLQSNKFQGVAAKSKYLSSFLPPCRAILSSVSNNSPTNANPLRDWLKSNQPQDSDSLFNGMKDAVVHPPQPAEK
jgi:hypothetical protein